MRKMRLLFICSCNLNRSPTFVLWFEKNHPEFDVKSTGCWHGYPDRVEQQLLDWADWIFVMDISHEMQLRRMFPEALAKLRIVGVSDEYDWNEKKLQEIVAYWYDNHFPATQHFPDCEGEMCMCKNRLKE